MAGDPLIATKMRVPALRQGLVARPRLRRRADASAAARLLLVSAPAGFGKTTFVTEWLGSLPTATAVAWVSLDERDDDQAVFWTYVVASLHQALPELSGRTSSLLEADTPIDVVLTALVNDLQTVGRDVVLVLDDLHVVHTTEVHDSLARLIDDLPLRARVVVSTRVDPPLPIARMRASGEVVEVRAADLRFTGDEAAAYLNDTMGLGLIAADVATLENRTEGWIAALQLAALSVQGRDDPSAFIETFAGDDRFVVDYLVSEVLDRQPPAARRFLLETSVLDRFTGPLCDAVTGTTGGRATLDALERENLFVVPLDDRRAWFRYHHLFADVLRAHLLAERPHVAPDLHRRASDWFAEHDEPDEAVRHALAADDPEQAAAVAELALPAMRRDRRDATLREWVAAIPADVVRSRPVLATGLAGVILEAGDLERVECILDDTEHWLAMEPDEQARSGVTIVDLGQAPSLPAAVEMYRAGLALIRGDVDACVAHARRMLELGDDADPLVRASAHAFLAIAAWHDGELDTAYAQYTDTVEGMRRIGHVADILSITIAMADLRVAQGRLREAEQLYADGLRLFTDTRRGPLRGVADMHVGLAEILCQRDERAAAAEELREAARLEIFGTPQYPYRARTVLAGLRLAEGDVAGCLDLLDQAERLYDTDFSPAVRPVSARRARAQVLLGDFGAARRWARERDLSLDDDARYIAEFEHITLTLVVVNDPAARGDLSRAGALLDRLLASAEAGDRGSSVIEILAVQAMVKDARGDHDGAVAALRRADALAGREGYVRVFNFLGPRLQAIRDEAADDARSPTFDATGGLVDPLSDRERDVLRLLRTDLSGPEIASELLVSLNTMRTHTKRIYMKLGVNNRREAVRRAAELDL